MLCLALATEMGEIAWFLVKITRRCPLFCLFQRVRQR